MRAAFAIAGLFLLLGLLQDTAHAAGFATDDRGHMYEIWPDEKTAERLGTVRVSEIRDGKTVSHVPVLTDLALSDLHGLYGISFTHLYKIDMRDPGRSSRVGALGGAGASFNALEFDSVGNLFALQGGALYRVDLKSGSAAPIGPLGDSYSSSGDLAWVGDSLYASVDRGGHCHLVRVDPKTGKATAVGRFRSASRARSARGRKAAPPPARGVAHDDVWGLIWDGRRLLALTARGEVLEIDRKTASATLLYRTRVTWHGSCPMLRI